MVAEGADRLALKDMAGLLQPETALELIPRLIQECQVPITFHAHATTGLALLNSVIAMQAGVDMIDTCITPFAGGTAHPPVEIMIVFAEKMGIKHNLNKKLILKIQKELFRIYDELQENIPNYGQFYRPFAYEDIDTFLVKEIISLVREATPESVRQAVPLARKLLQSLSFPAFDERILESQIPGGMLSNLQSQLKLMGMSDILNQVLEEVPRVRRDMGYVTLVTPTSQIVGSQATFNVMTGQPYSMMSNETKMLLRGEFGKPPAPFNQELVEKVLSENDQKQIKYRPGSYLHPVLEDTAKPAYIKTHKDLLLHFMLGQPADEFLQKRK
jgi:pyruvate/oxaloacetate carboxyltransferase